MNWLAVLADMSCSECRDRFPKPHEHFPKSIEDWHKALANIKRKEKEPPHDPV